MNDHGTVYNSIYLLNVTQELDGIRRVPFATQKVRQPEVKAGLFQARKVPPQREALLERQRRPLE